MPATQKAPTRLADHPAYKKASNELVNLQQHKRELEERAQEIRQVVGNSSGSESEKIEAEALQMLGNSDAQNRAELRSELADIERGIKVTAKAIEIQQEAANEVRKQADEEAADAFAPEWHGVILEVADLVEQLADALQREEAIRREVRGRGFTTIGPFLYERQLYDPRPGEWALPRQLKPMRQFAERVRERVEDQNQRIARRGGK